MFCAVSFFELCSLSQLPASQLPLAMACPDMGSKGKQHQGQEKLNFGPASPGAPLCLCAGQPSGSSHSCAPCDHLLLSQAVLFPFHALALLRPQGQQDQLLLPSPMAPRLVSSQCAAEANCTFRGAPYPNHARSPIASRSRISCAHSGARHSKMLLLRPLDH